ncbi:MAG: M48 family metallopeptidase [Bacilli bacterium]|nr:M48 family metallopeptidase [Bacilli bacterium]
MRRAHSLSHHVSTVAKREREYELDGVVYTATISYKRMQSMTLRFDAERRLFRVSVPSLTPLSSVDAFVKHHMASLLKRAKPKRKPYEDGFLYYLGERLEVGELEPKEEMRYYKKRGLPYLKERVEFFSKQMGVDASYKVRMRDMKRTFGSNSRKTMTLTFQCRLMAFAPDIVDSVVVHELAHHFRFDHSPSFYKVVYRYCPNYDQLRRKLIHDKYEG